MPTMIFARSHNVWGLLGAVLMNLAPVQAQDTDDPSQLLEEFLHYTMIAKPDLAAAYAQQLLGSAISDAQLAELLDEGDAAMRDRFDAALGKANML